MRSYVEVGGAGEPRWAYVRHRVTPDGLVPFDTLPVPELEELEEREVGAPVVSSGGLFAVTIFSIPFMPRPVSTPDLPEGFWVSRLSTEYHLAKMSPRGDTLLVVDREHTPRPVTEAEIDEIMARFGENPPIDRGEFPEVHPPFTDVDVGVDGMLWAEREDADGDPFWDHFDAGGVYLGELRLPEGVRGFQLRHITEDAIYGRALGEFDEQYVVRLGIRKGGR